MQSIKGGIQKFHLKSNVRMCPNHNPPCQLAASLLCFTGMPCPIFCQQMRSMPSPSSVPLLIFKFHFYRIFNLKYFKFYANITLKYNHFKTMKMEKSLKNNRQIKIHML